MIYMVFQTRHFYSNIHFLIILNASMCNISFLVAFGVSPNTYCWTCSNMSTLPYFIQHFFSILPEIQSFSSLYYIVWLVFISPIQYLNKVFISFIQCNFLKYFISVLKLGWWKKYKKNIKKISMAGFLSRQQFPKLQNQCYPSHKIWTQSNFIYFNWNIKNIQRLKLFSINHPYNFKFIHMY